MPTATDAAPDPIDLRVKPADYWIARLCDSQDKANDRQEALLTKLVDGMPNAKLVHGAAVALIGLFGTAFMVMLFAVLFLRGVDIGAVTDAVRATAPGTVTTTTTTGGE